ncbi:hypothetical protein [Puniceibacterium confluentis]|uniref:hypothetical protein n=1 Tax=Puniceibacterium confluentis TaxID=1958944 RepID=UPI0011B51E98|nr:hypothetical protein [Puniceibacterium confluentis]
MSNAQSAYVALILPDAATAPDAVFFLKSARRALSRLDAGSGEAPKVSTPRLRTAADTLDLRVQLTTSETQGLRATIQATAFRQAPFCPDHAAQVLSALALDMIDMAEISAVEWDDPGVSLSVEDFINLRRYVSPRRKKSPPAPQSKTRPAAPTPPSGTGVQRAAIPDCDAAARRLIRRFMEEVPDADLPQRPPEKAPSLAAGTSGTVEADAIEQNISADPATPLRPTGMFQGLRDLPGRALCRARATIRAINFRMATHVLTVSALFAILHSSDRLTGMLNHLTR